MCADKEAEFVDDPQDLIASVDDEIVTSVKQYYLWWRIWNTLTISATAASILFSFVASVVAATKAVQSPFIAATIAGVPAVILSLSQTIKFSERADWFWNLVVQYQSLQRALERKDFTHADASRRIDEIEGMSFANDPARANPKSSLQK